MIVPWALLMFLTGAVYGTFVPPWASRVRALGFGLVTGLLLAGFAVATGARTGAHPLGFSTTGPGVFAAVLLLTILFGAGAWLGTLVRDATEKYSAPRE